MVSIAIALYIIVVMDDDYTQTKKTFPSLINNYYVFLKTIGSCNKMRYYSANVIN